MRRAGQDKPIAFRLPTTALLKEAALDCPAPSLIALFSIKG